MYSIKHVMHLFEQVDSDLFRRFNGLTSPPEPDPEPDPERCHGNSSNGIFHVTSW